MRYSEIVETENAAAKIAKEQEKRRKAYADLSAARDKRNDAVRKQQETTKAANEKERRAKATLSQPIG